MKDALLIHPSSFILLSAVLVFPEELSKTGIVPDRVEIAVLTHVAEVAIAELDGAAQRLDGLVWPFEQGVAARQVVVGQRVVGPELHEALVDLQSLGVA